MSIAHYLSGVQVGEQQLAEAYKSVSERHSREFEAREMCKKFSEWSTFHVKTLQPYVDEYGKVENASLQQLRGSLFHGSRAGSLGLLHDLQDLGTLANAVRTHYTILHQSTASIIDEDLEALADQQGAEIDRELHWLCTQIKDTSPQAVVVPTNLGKEGAASVPNTPTPAAIPDQLWGPLVGGLLALVVGVLSLLFGRVWLFPSLGPTIYLQTEKPADPGSRFYNVVVGHLLGVLAGFAGVFLLAAYNDPVTLTQKVLTPGRMGAAVIALALTLLLTLLAKANHPPAGATTLLVALGSIKTLQDVLNLAIGVLIVAVLGELTRKLRTGRATQAVLQPSVPAESGKP